MKSRKASAGYGPLLAFCILSILVISCTKDESTLNHRQRRGSTAAATTPPPPPAITIPVVPNPLLKFDISWEQANALVPGVNPNAVCWYPNSIEWPGGGPRPVVVQDPFNTANKVVKITVDENSRDGERIRNELTAWNLTTGMRQLAAYGLKVYIPTDFKTDQRAMNFIQLHSVSSYSRIPAVNFMLKSRQLDLNLAWATSLNAPTHQGDVHYYFDVSNWFGRWVSIVFLVNWYPDNNGFVKLYFDGNLVKEYYGPIGYNGDSQGPYFKWGLHYPGGELPAGSTSTSQTVYYENIKIGNGVSYSDVQP